MYIGRYASKVERIEECKGGFGYCYVSIQVLWTSSSCLYILYIIHSSVKKTIYAAQTSWPAFSM